MWLTFLDCSRTYFMYFYMKYKYFFFPFSVVHFFQGTSVSTTFYLFEHYQLWMMDSKAQRVFLAKTSKLCTMNSAPVIILSLVHLFQLWVPKSQNGECWLTGYRTISSLPFYNLNTFFHHKEPFVKQKGSSDVKRFFMEPFRQKGSSM